MNAAMVPGPRAVKLMDLAGAVFDIPTRYRGGNHFHQNIVGADIRFRIIAVFEPVRPTEFKQADGLHRGQFQVKVRGKCSPERWP